MAFGFWEALLILAIVLVIFGAGKLPTVMGDLAKGIKTFKAGLKEEEGTASTPREPEQLPPPRSEPPKAA
ncbi:MAG: twin-arginine translocase TatA/TatE family subunit [Geminicoccaceae bacterium]|nr:twin-arginine translocase TatA/TatE family subunit [Geminicoccaceae bacterium]MCS7266976.1 twin-arginine translocase TatA/TatE family subunit [Geminicoccaceae bacterium]MCX7628798.1 twin-arginine translocase TatA/TatE family subunit [Geminicoccaceae bacterium]MDW8123403.1 twin-arginine translocase TatA/TatE family subunit [Geminicoccaceae bacterium]MDW8341657.1 twin-arginine translocase TatA/TatE family subunit [Geminicoccaceae bacterium]